MFYIVIRIFINDRTNHSVEYFNVSDYADQDACHRAAEARFHNIISADLQNANVVYQMTSIVDNSGANIERPVVFDRRPAPVEPEE